MTVRSVLKLLCCMSITISCCTFMSCFDRPNYLIYVSCSWDHLRTENQFQHIFSPLPTFFS
ncbi:hypothetical protein KC19_3G175300 [Ceratodon purpureus]|uniref:Uncharacterized protein n=1 Tax=Ceratodon purpureus TaxID=3225 RepID=A0A8T0IM69_CERPU|nr:hypothetical protein KC19_3G175300 [Ceratodon purpureus]